MKKLRDKATSKSKKSSSKASKKKFDDFGRPRIPKDNKDELHVWVQREILKFTMLEFSIIISLKCIGNIDDYMYTSSSKSMLMSKYFPNNKGAITRSKLITCVQMENFDNAEDASNLTILFFVHTFMFSQYKEAPISVAHFQMVEDDRYIHFPWGKVTFEKLMSFWQQDFNIAKQLYSLGRMPHVLNVWMFECCSEHSYKNIQPTIEEVSRLDLSFSRDFETFDPTNSALTSIAGTLKRTTDEFQQCIGTIAEEFDNFSTIPPRKILIKAGFTLPVSPDQSLKRKKTVMFQKDSPAVMDDDTSGRNYPVHVSDLYSETQKDATDKGEIGVSEFQHHHHGEIGATSPQSHQYKSVPSSSTQPEGTSKSSLDGDEIKNYINKCDVNTADKEAGREDDLKNEDYSDLKALEDSQSQRGKNHAFDLILLSSPVKS
ncbi:hypothetical protein BC332_19128 [Capsicum chinense]|nr:hypothetical protein BC332_19128 [Capsicum chinense]